MIFMIFALWLAVEAICSVDTAAVYDQQIFDSTAAALRSPSCSAIPIMVPSVTTEIPMLPSSTPDTLFFVCDDSQQILEEMETEETANPMPPVLPSTPRK